MGNSHVDKVGVSKYSKNKSNCGTLIVFLLKKKLPVNIADHRVTKTSHIENCSIFFFSFISVKDVLFHFSLSEVHNSPGPGRYESSL